MSVLRTSSVRYLNDVAVPMRDGVRLSADLYLPATGDGPWPVLVSRTPYDNNLLFELGQFWAQQDYVYVAQDVPGAGTTPTERSCRGTTRPTTATTPWSGSASSHGATATSA